MTTVENVRWDLEPLVDGDGEAGVDKRLTEAETIATDLTEKYRGRVGELDAAGMADLMRGIETMRDHLQRAYSYASLRYAVDTRTPAHGALAQRVQERGATLSAKLVWAEIEWLAVPEEQAAAIMADPAVDFCAHYLERIRARREHVLSEPEERILAEKSPTGAAAWARLFGDLTSSMEVVLDGETKTLEDGLSRLQSPDRSVRQTAALAVTEALAPGLRTRGYVFNTLLADKSIDDRLRGWPTWISAWNTAQEASDESVEALVAAVVARYDIPQRWYALKAQLLGIDRLADYDRMAPLVDDDTPIGWEEARGTIIDAYGSFSGVLAGIVEEFLTEAWIDAPAQAGKRGGAFCAYTVPGHHPYVLLNWTSRRRDVLTLAHELGHACHGYLARSQGIFHQATPLTVAETASVFGETVTFERLLATTDDPAQQLALLAGSLEDHIATVFRQVAMNRFEEAVHNHRRTAGELSVDDFAEHWERTQSAMLGDAVEITDGYKSWWSYIPHFINTPGYVYAYAFGQLLALSVYARYRDVGEAFVPSYVDMLAAGGSRSPEALAAMVDCDLADPEFWAKGLDIIANHLRRTEEAARAAGRI